MRAEAYLRRPKSALKRFLKGALPFALCCHSLKRTNLRKLGSNRMRWDSMISEGMRGNGCGIYEDAGVVEAGMLPRDEGASSIGPVLQKLTINQA